MRYSIYEGNMERLTKKMTRIQNKCRKYGCDFRFEEVGEEYKELKDSFNRPYIARFVIVEAEGIAKVNGWRFIATLEHTDNGNIIKSVVNDIEVPERYYSCEMFCEHCNSNRYRNKTYLLMNEETGEFKQVGKSCLCDFTHGMSAELIAEYTSMFDDLIEGEYFEGGSFKQYVNTEDFLCYVSECIRSFGYTKRFNEECELSTKDRALGYYLSDFCGDECSPEMRRECREEMEDAGINAESTEVHDKVKAALKWIADQPEDNNYIHNLRTICSTEYAEITNLGILASLLPTYNREMAYQRHLNAEKNACSDYVGEVGEKVILTVDDVQCLTSWETKWGVTRIYKIIDKSGNIYTWKTSACLPDNVVTIKGTVKSHNEYKGERQTELSRCKIA